MTPRGASSFNSLDALSRVALLAFAACIGLGLLVPLYVDEVATKIVQARFLAEGGQMVSLFPQCRSGFLLDTPLTWYPAALVFSLLYAYLPPIGLRIAGISLFLAWLAACWTWRHLAFPEPHSQLRTIAGMAAIVGIGVLPLTMILTRPEQWLVFVLTLFLALAAAAGRAASWSRARAAALLAAFLLLTSLLNYAHPKALFFLPFVLVAAWYAFGRQRPAMLGLATVFALLCAFQTFGVARAVVRCEEAPILSRILAAQTTDVSLLARKPSAFVVEAVGNVLAAPGRIASHAVFQSRYQSAWLPPVPFATDGPVVKAVNFGISAVLHAAFLLAVLLPPVALLRSRRGGGKMPLLFPALWVGFVGHLALYKEWNFYGGTLVVVLAGLLIVDSLDRLWPAGRLRGLGTGVFAAVLALLIASTAVLASQMAPRLIKVARSTDELPENQMYSVNAFAFGNARDRIRNLAESCGLEADGSSRLVVDELTYFAFSGLHQPIHLGFLAPGGFGADVAGRTRNLLEDMGSEGIIARCDLVGPEFRRQVFREGKLCCVDLIDPSPY